MKIAVVGAGYVGLVTGAIHSLHEHDVLCVDRDRLVIEDLKNGVLPLFEPGLKEVVQNGISRGNLNFTSDLQAAVTDADIVCLCVEVPRLATGAVDLSNLFDVAEEIAGRLKRESTVIIMSSVPIGTNAKVAKTIRDYCYYDIEVVSIPHFLREGSALEDGQNPDRLVIGARMPQTIQVLGKLYEPLLVALGRPCPMIVMSPESAEMTKYTANSLLAMKASFVNEISTLCEHLGADIEHVRQGIGSDRRIGWEFLRPDLESGSQYFSADVRSLSMQAKDANCDSRLLQAIDAVNEKQKEVIPQKILEHFDHDLRGKRIAIWGLAVGAPNEETCDPLLAALIQRLKRSGASISVHSPVTGQRFQRAFGNEIEYHPNKYTSLQDADALVVMTSRPEYLAADPSVLQKHMRNLAVFDGQNCLNRERFIWNKFDFHSVGHGTAHAEHEFSRDTNYSMGCI